MTKQELTKIIEKYIYLIDSENYSFSKCARLIIKKHNLNQSHRSISRRVASLYKSMRNSTKEVIDRKEDDKKMTLQYKGWKSIRSRDEAVKFFKIDLKKYDIAKFEHTAYDVSMRDKSGDPITVTNYRTFVQCVPKPEPFDVQAMHRDIEFYFGHLKKFKKPSGKKVQVVAITDVHIGAKVNSSKGLINTKDFDLKILVEYLNEIVEQVNATDSIKDVVILGDLIESFTGLNHINTWQGLEEDAFYAGPVIIAHKFFSKFLKSIKKLRNVYIVSGNHDRGTSSSKEDNRGAISEIVAYMLNQEFHVEHHPLVIAKEIDGIGYVFTHGHFGISKQAIAKIILDYGIPKKYNVVLQGHLHSRNTKKEYWSSSLVKADSANYRAVTVAPLFTGNFFSEGLGYTSSAGFSLLMANSKKDNVHHFDYSL